MCLHWSFTNNANVITLILRKFSFLFILLLLNIDPFSLILILRGNLIKWGWDRLELIQSTKFVSYIHTYQIHCYKAKSFLSSAIILGKFADFTSFSGLPAVFEKEIIAFLRKMELRKGCGVKVSRWSRKSSSSHLESEIWKVECSWITITLLS